MADPINPEQWARICAKAWLEPAFQHRLERDPAAAIATVVEQFALPQNARLLDLEYMYTSPDELDFKSLTADQLKEIVQQGTLAGHTVQITASQWVSPTLTVPNPSDKSLTGPTTVASNTTYLAHTSAISLSDWTRIYAYIWYQEKYKNNQFCRAEFEKDPAATTALIVKNLQDEFNVAIKYTYQTTQLFNLGSPPSDLSIDRLLVISKNVDLGISQKPYTFRIKLCC